MPLPKKAVLSSAAFFYLCLAGCSGLPPQGKTEEARNRAMAAGFEEIPVDTPRFRLYSLLRTGEAGRPVRIYIEGDGPPWPHPYLPPEDPTPVDAVALELALQDRKSPVAYLARPCQYIRSPDCRPAYWSAERFSPEVVAGYQAALDQLKSRSGSSRISLVGYSGGGVLASLLAASRSDVAELLTIGSPLDTAAWVRHHDLTPLAGANPADQADRLARLPQHHWVGERDEVVPARIVKGFAEGLGRPDIVSVVPGYDHQCCWAENRPLGLDPEE